MSNFKESFKFFEVLSHPIRLNIIKQLNVSSKQFSDLLSAVDGFDSSKLNFHLKKLIDANIIVKKERDYQLSDFGLKTLFFIEAYENDDFKSKPITKFDSFFADDGLEASNIFLEIEKNRVDKSKLSDTKIMNLPLGVQTFDYYVGEHATYMQEKYFLSLPDAIDNQIDPKIWIKEFVKPIEPLIHDLEAFQWLEDRFLKLAYGTRGMQGYCLMDACLAVPPMKTMITPLQNALIYTGKAGLFATTGMGKSRILLYLARWWTDTFKTHVVFIQNPQDLLLAEWDILYEILTANISKKQNEPKWLIIIEDLHLVSLETFEKIKRLISNSGSQSWSVLIAFTEILTTELSQPLFLKDKKIDTLQFLKDELQPLEISQFLNLSLIWLEWRPYFYEWIRWVALDILVNKIHWDSSHWKIVSQTLYLSPWSFIVSLGFLKIALTNFVSSSTSNVFPLLLYSFLAQLYILRSEQGIRLQELIKLLNKTFHYELLDLFHKNDWERDISLLLDNWTDPRVRLLPPFTYTYIRGTLRREPIITFYHVEWANEVCNVLFEKPYSQICEMVSKLFEHLLPTSYYLWSKITGPLRKNEANFLHWLRLNVRIELINSESMVLTYLRINEEQYQHLKDIQLPLELERNLTNIEMLNWAFIQSILSNFDNENVFTTLSKKKIPQ